MIPVSLTYEQAKDMAFFRSRLRQLMLAKSLEDGQQITQTEVADQAKVSFSTIQRLYKPDYTFDSINADTLAGLLRYFNCKFEDLIEVVD